MGKVIKENKKVQLIESEAKIQSDFHVWLWNAYPQYRRCCFAIPNGGLRSATEAMSLRGQGVVPGIPDYFIAIPNASRNGLFIEFKRPDAKLSGQHWENQKKAHEALLNQNFAVVVCKSAEDARNVFENYIAAVKIK